MFRIVEVKPLPAYRLWVRFADGQEGEIDLSDLAGKGVFAIWDEYAEFERVYIGTQGQLCWGEGIDLCPDALYLKLTGKTPEQLFSNLDESEVNA